MAYCPLPATLLIPRLLRARLHDDHPPAPPPPPSPLPPTTQGTALDQPSSPPDPFSPAGSWPALQLQLDPPEITAGDILPFATPRAMYAWERVFIIDGRAIQLVAERWRDEDAAHCAYPLESDPCKPGESMAIQLLSLATGDSSSALDATAVAALRPGRDGQYCGDVARN